MDGELVEDVDVGVDVTEPVVEKVEDLDEARSQFVKHHRRKWYQDLRAR